jgi:thiamine biosynthesis lipoprotein
MQTRRRFLSLTASVIAAPGIALASTGTTWTGRALGAEAMVTLRGPMARAKPALIALTQTLDRIERALSLYREDSALVWLNREGWLVNAPEDLLAVLDLADQLHGWTAGRFDPCVQPQWLARAEERAPIRAEGWAGVHISGASVRLAPGQALTLNGIAQGYATDVVADLLKAHGFGEMLVNVGEYRAEGGPWHLGLEDPVHGMIGTKRLTDRAIATSAADGMRLPGGSHLIDPIAGQAPLWSSISVEARTAAVADGLSTALIFEDIPSMADILARAQAQATVVDRDGNVRRV